MSKPKDWTGQKYGKLTLVEISDKRTNHKGILWKAICECGNTIDVRPYSVASGATKSCGCLTSTYQREDGVRRKYPPIISTARNVWRKNYQELSFDEFFELSQHECFYCSSPPASQTNIKENKHHKPSSNQTNHGTFTYNGLDRIDSNKGHTVDNVVPCCWTCNKMKSNMTLDEFLDHIERLYGHTRRLCVEDRHEPTYYPILITKDSIRLAG